MRNKEYYTVSCDDKKHSNLLSALEEVYEIGLVVFKMLLFVDQK